MMIRLATVMDLSELYHMLYVMHSETSHNLSPIVSEKLTTAISMSLHRGVVLVAEVDGHIIGSIGGWKQPTGGAMKSIWLTCGFLCIKNIENQQQRSNW
jgi:hypothetical protein